VESWQRNSQGTCLSSRKFSKDFQRKTREININALEQKQQENKDSHEQGIGLHLT
jgi:hypothetical protein